jgi:acetate kinase
MRILTLNSGSSSLKYSLWDMPSRKQLSAGVAQRIGIGNGFINHTVLGKETIVARDSSTHETAFNTIIELLVDPARGIIRDVSEIDGVGHRVVHGGDKFAQSVRIDDQVIKAIEEFSALAPLHNPPNLMGIRAAMKYMPSVPHVAVFDTAFFATLPPHVHIYALPYEWYEKHQVRKYGFHGTSHLYVARRTAALLNKEPSDVNIITFHIGNGVSVTAVKKGVAYDHSMGFTPLEGAVMGTRCGDIDPAIVFYMMKRENLSATQMDEILNKRSGLLGITGRHVDRRDVIEAAKAGNVRAKLAFEIECYRLRKYIGAYSVAMDGADAIAFTAGVGENSPLHRAKICGNLEFLGIKLDGKKNQEAKGGVEMEISAPDSRCKVFVVPTNEELVIAEDVVTLLERGQERVH